MVEITANKKASANPTKAFFVKMITRDISLDDCILDLVDNSIDSAWSSEGSRPTGLAVEADLSKYKIEINISENEFLIKDNCGGMTLDIALNHAFSFGRTSLEDHDNYSIGVYGIGMKRAVFKIGNVIQIRSTYSEKNSTRQSFSVPIDVSKWLENDSPPWDFDLEEAESLEEDGVEIKIIDLNNGATSSFENPAFLQNLRRTLGRDYSLHLNRGLKIILNGEPVHGWTIELRQSASFLPMRLAYEDKLGEDTVSIEIIGGMAAPPPESSDPDEDDDGDKRFGWYVVCNGRIVLAADKTSISGWGTENWPQWHRQYSGFIGIILFTSAKASALPMTTTKRSVDQSSEVYRRAKPKMREITRAWIDYTNMRKQAIEEAKKAEAEATSVTIYDVTPRAVVALPKFAAQQQKERLANVQYSVSLSKLKRLAKELGNVNMAYREVGQQSFDYTYQDMVGDE